MTAYGQHTHPGYFDRLQERTLHVPKAETELSQNLSAIDTCLEEFNSKIENIILVLREYAQRQILRLQKAKADLEREVEMAVAEVEESWYMDDPPLIQAFSRQFRNFAYEKEAIVFKYEIDESQFPASLEDILKFSITLPIVPEPVKIQETDKKSVTEWKVQDKTLPRIQLLWVKGTASFLRKISFNVIREICSYLEADFKPHFLPGIKGNNLRLYDLHGGETKETTLTKTFTEGTMYCIVSDRSILCLGGHNIEGSNTSDVYSLELDTYQLSLFPSMSVGREYFGVLKYEEFVYIFGGNVSPSIVSCEKFNLKSREWLPLLDMAYPRYAFSPAEFHSDVYLADSFQPHKRVEVFNLRTELFKTLPLTLESLSTNGVCFIADEELVVLTSAKAMGRWRIGAADTRFQIGQVQTSISPICINCQPIQIGREVMMIHYARGDLLRFNIDTQVLS